MVVLLFPVEEDFLADDDEEGVDELFFAELFSDAFRSFSFRF